MTITLSLEKQESIKKLCLEIISSPEITIRKLACVIGKIVSSFPAVKYGKLHYRELEIEKIDALKNNQGDFDRKITLIDIELRLTIFLLKVQLNKCAEKG